MLDFYWLWFSNNLTYIEPHSWGTVVSPIDFIMIKCTTGLVTIKLKNLDICRPKTFSFKHLIYFHIVRLPWMHAWEPLQKEIPKQIAFHKFCQTIIYGDSWQKAILYLHPIIAHYNNQTEWHKHVYEISHAWNKLPAGSHLSPKLSPPNTWKV